MKKRVGFDVEGKELCKGEGFYLREGNDFILDLFETIFSDSSRFPTHPKL